VPATKGEVSERAEVADQGVPAKFVEELLPGCSLGEDLEFCALYLEPKATLEAARAVGWTKWGLATELLDMSRLPLVGWRAKAA
jgi:hypothetical protein